MRRSGGFTIIELMLFLTISSSLAVLLLVGTGAAIQRQQYRDAVQSYAGFLRGQYEQVLSVQNERAEGECKITGSSSKRGQSDCIVIGRYIETESFGGAMLGEKYSARQVYALKEPATGWKYSMTEPDTDYTMHWNSKTHFIGQARDTVKIAVLIYRDPEHGTIVVRTNSGQSYTSTNIKDFFEGKTDLGVVGDAQFAAREVCVYDSKWLSGERQSVFLGFRAGSSDSVAVGRSSEGCQGD